MMILSALFSGDLQADVFAAAGSTVYVPWASFARIGTLLLFAGFGTRCLVIMFLAQRGTENLNSLVFKLIGSIAGVILVEQFF